MARPLPYPPPAYVRELLSGILLTLTLFACAQWRRPTGPIPFKIVPAARPAATRPLVVVLPGRNDSLEDLDRSGMGAAVQRAWPGADVLLAGATLSYYADGKIAERLHEDVIVPARQQGYREIWLSGASMGGMGALLYEQRYPHDVTGLVLYAPYMGAPSLIREIAAAGGPTEWNPGVPPRAVDADNYQTELWRLVKGWQNPAEAQRIWLACGDQDRFIASCRMVATVLPADHFIEVPGGHDWPIWDRAAAAVFMHMAAAR